MSLFTRPALFLSTVLIAGAAFAGGHGSPEDIHKARNALMKDIGKNVGVLSKMVKGSSDYDAAAAETAAAELVALSSEDMDKLWAEGTASDAIPTSRLKPEALADLDGLKAKHQAMVDAAAVLQAAAGEGLDPMKTAFAAFGATCGDCHKPYRGPKPE